MRTPKSWTPEHITEGLWLEWTNNIRRLKHAKNKREAEIAKHRLDSDFNILGHFFTFQTLGEPLKECGYEFADIFNACDI